MEHRGIKKTIENSKIIKSLPTNIDRKNSAYYELQSSVIYGLLANSHSWKGSNEKIVATISTKLCNLDNELIEHPREMLDLVCIADVGTWSASKWPIPAFYPENSKKVSETFYSSFTESLKKSNPNNKLVTPVGALVSKLTQKIAREYEGIQWLALHYMISGISGIGIGSGKYTRKWDLNIYSDYVRQMVEKGYREKGLWPKLNDYFD